jgi:GNAT superfamily N-acetyltransferase
MTTHDLVVRVASADDASALAGLRASWTGGVANHPEFAAEMARWLKSEGERRTTWIALIADRPAGMASLFEYRRMPRPRQPPSRWGYISNMFVRGEVRNRGVGAALLGAIITAAEQRDYARLVLSPSPQSLEFYRRAGFVVPDGAPRADRLLVRQGR